ncbi:MAG: hypothetical protein H7A01_12060 [Hahellaceae bacterium]|nr:hypothetical protein [Hahellaceae bacterium]MCP5209947.1 hypothetical protein [Hahellaceae bacterium]
MEEIAEGLIKLILRSLGFLVRALIFLIYELWFEIIAWYVGWPICRIITFGYYPKVRITEHELASLWCNIVVSIIGFSSLLGLAILLVPWE